MKTNRMKICWQKELLFLVTLIVAVLLMPMKAAAQATQIGTIGENGGIILTYDAESKVLTVTGEDNLRGETDSINNVCRDAEKIVFQNCKLSGDATRLCAGLKAVTSIEFNEVDTSNVTDMYAMFEWSDNLTTLDVSDWDVSNVTTMHGMFHICSNLTSLDVSGWDTSKVTDMSYMFEDCSNLTTLDVSGFDTSNVTSMQSTFNYCSNLTTLDVSNFDTSNVTDMYAMFFGCSNLTSLDVSGFDTSNVVSMRSMFGGCNNLVTLDVSGFDTSKVGNMGHMFGGCSNLMILDVSGFDTSNVMGMDGMFYNCSNLETLDASGFDTSKVTNMELMFSECDNLATLDVSGFDTSNVTNMRWMFDGCSDLVELDMSSFDTSNVTMMEDMLRGCDNLRVIYSPKEMAEAVELPGTFYDSQGNCVNELTSSSCNQMLRTDWTDIYIGNINSELISFDLKQNVDGAYYLTGQIVVVEWVDGQSTVPKDAPTMIFKSTDGTEEIDVFVTPTGTNTYYFDRFIEGLSPNKEYVFEIASGTESNISPNRSMNVLLSTSPKMVPIKNLGKIGEQKISYYEADNGELRLYRQHSEYVGHINSELIKTELVKGPNGNYVSGQIVVVEWVNDVSTVPLETPIMYFKSTDNKEVLPVFITPTGTNTYYFDRSLGDMDTSKEYVFTIESGDEMNVSPYRSMIVTTAAMKNKTGTLWESDTQYVRYRTDANTAELRIYAVNK